MKEEEEASTIMLKSKGGRGRPRKKSTGKGESLHDGNVTETMTKTSLTNPRRDSMEGDDIPSNAKVSKQKRGRGRPRTQSSDMNESFDVNLSVATSPAFKNSPRKHVARASSSNTTSPQRVPDISSTSDIDSPKRRVVRGSSSNTSSPQRRVVRGSSSNTSSPQRHIARGSSLNTNSPRRRLETSSSSDIRRPKLSIVRRSSSNTNSPQRHVVKRSSLNTNSPRRRLKTSSSSDIKHPRRHVVRASSSDYTATTGEVFVVDSMRGNSFEPPKPKIEAPDKLAGSNVMQTPDVTVVEMLPGSSSVNCQEAQVVTVHKPKPSSSTKSNKYGLKYINPCKMTIQMKKLNKYLSKGIPKNKCKKPVVLVEPVIDNRLKCELCAERFSSQDHYSYHLHKHFDSYEEYAAYINLNSGNSTVTKADDTTEPESSESSASDYDSSQDEEEEEDMSVKSEDIHDDISEDISLNEEDYSAHVKDGSLLHERSSQSSPLQREDKEFIPKTMTFKKSLKVCLHPLSPQVMEKLKVSEGYSTVDTGSDADMTSLCQPTSRWSHNENASIDITSKTKDENDQNSNMPKHKSGNKSVVHSPSKLVNRTVSVSSRRTSKLSKVDSDVKVETWSETNQRGYVVSSMDEKESDMSLSDPPISKKLKTSTDHKKTKARTVQDSSVIPIDGKITSNIRIRRRRKQTKDQGVSNAILDESEKANVISQQKCAEVDVSDQEIFKESLINEADIVPTRQQTVEYSGDDSIVDHEMAESNDMTEVVVAKGDYKITIKYSEDSKPDNTPEDVTSNELRQLDTNHNLVDREHFNKHEQLDTSENHVNREHFTKHEQLDTRQNLVDREHFNKHEQLDTRQNLGNGEHFNKHEQLDTSHNHVNREYFTKHEQLDTRQNLGNREHFTKHEQLDTNQNHVDREHFTKHEQLDTNQNHVDREHFTKHEQLDTNQNHVDREHFNKHEQLDTRQNLGNREHFNKQCNVTNSTDRKIQTTVTKSKQNEIATKTNTKTKNSEKCHKDYKCLRKSKSRDKLCDSLLSDSTTSNKEKHQTKCRNSIKSVNKKYLKDSSSISNHSKRDLSSSEKVPSSTGECDSKLEVQVVRCEYNDVVTRTSHIPSTSSVSPEKLQNLKNCALLKQQIAEKRKPKVRAKINLENNLNENNIGCMNTDELCDNVTEPCNKADLKEGECGLESRPEKSKKKKSLSSNGNKLERKKSSKEKFMKEDILSSPKGTRQTIEKESCMDSNSIKQSTLDVNGKSSISLQTCCVKEIDTHTAKILHQHEGFDNNTPIQDIPQNSPRHLQHNNSSINDLHTSETTSKIEKMNDSEMLMVDMKELKSVGINLSDDSSDGEAVDFVKEVKSVGFTLSDDSSDGEGEDFIKEVKSVGFNLSDDSNDGEDVDFIVDCEDEAETIEECIKLSNISTSSGVPYDGKPWCSPVINGFKVNQHVKNDFNMNLTATLTPERNDEGDGTIIGKDLGSPRVVKLSPIKLSPLRGYDETDSGKDPMSIMKDIDDVYVGPSNGALLEMCPISESCLSNPSVQIDNYMGEIIRTCQGDSNEQIVKINVFQRSDCHQYTVKTDLNQSYSDQCSVNMDLNQSNSDQYTINTDLNQSDNGLYEVKTDLNQSDNSKCLVKTDLNQSDTRQFSMKTDLTQSGLGLNSVNPQDVCQYPDSLQADMPQHDQQSVPTYHNTSVLALPVNNYLMAQLFKEKVTENSSGLSDTSIASQSPQKKLVLHQCKSCHKRFRSNETLTLHASLHCHIQPSPSAVNGFVENKNDQLEQLSKGNNSGSDCDTDRHKCQWKGVDSNESKQQPIMGVNSGINCIGDVDRLKCESRETSNTNTDRYRLQAAGDSESAKNNHMQAEMDNSHVSTSSQESVVNKLSDCANIPKHQTPVKTEKFIELKSLLSKKPIAHCGTPKAKRFPENENNVVLLNGALIETAEEVEVVTSITEDQLTKNKGKVQSERVKSNKYKHNDLLEQKEHMRKKEQKRKRKHSEENLGNVKVRKTETFEAPSELSICPRCNMGFPEQDFFLHKISCVPSVPEQTNGFYGKLSSEPDPIDDTSSDISQCSRSDLKVVLKKVKTCNSIINGTSLKFCGSIENPTWTIKNSKRKKKEEKLIPPSVNGQDDVKSKQDSECERSGGVTEHSIEIKNQDDGLHEKGRESTVLETVPNTECKVESNTNNKSETVPNIKHHNPKDKSKVNEKVVTKPQDVVITDFEKQLLVVADSKGRDKDKSKKKPKSDHKSSEKHHKDLKIESKHTQKKHEPITEPQKHFNNSKIAQKIYKRDKERTAGFDDGLPDFSKSSVKLDHLPELVVGKSISENTRHCKTKDDPSHSANSTSRTSRVSNKELKESIESLGIVQKSNPKDTNSDMPWVQTEDGHQKKRSYGSKDSTFSMHSYKIPTFDFQNSKFSAFESIVGFSGSDNQSSTGSLNNIESASFTGFSYESCDVSNVSFDRDDSVTLTNQHSLSSDVIGHSTPATDVNFNIEGFDFLKRQDDESSFTGHTGPWESFVAQQNLETTQIEESKARNTNVVTSTPYFRQVQAEEKLNSDNLDISQLSSIHEKSEPAPRKKPRLNRFKIDDGDSRVVQRKQTTDQSISGSPRKPRNQSIDKPTGKQKSTTNNVPDIDQVEDALSGGQHVVGKVNKNKDVQSAKESNDHASKHVTFNSFEGVFHENVNDNQLTDRQQVHFEVKFDVDFGEKLLEDVGKFEDQFDVEMEDDVEESCKEAFKDMKEVKCHEKSPHQEERDFNWGKTDTNIGKDNFQSENSDLESEKYDLENEKCYLQSDKRDHQRHKNDHVQRGKNDCDSEKSDLSYEKRELKSYKNYSESNKSDLESNKSDLESDKSELESNKSDLESNKSDLESNKSDLESNKSDLESDLGSDLGCDHESQDNVSVDEDAHDEVNTDTKPAIKSVPMELTEITDDILYLSDPDMDMFEDEVSEDDTLRDDAKGEAQDVEGHPEGDVDEQELDTDKPADDRVEPLSSIKEDDEVKVKRTTTRWDNPRKPMRLPRGYCFNFFNKRKCSSTPCIYSHNMPSQAEFVQSFKEHLERGEDEICLDILQTHANIHDMIGNRQLENLYGRLRGNVECFWLIKILYNRGLLNQIIVDNYIRAFAFPAHSEYLFAVFEMAKAINMQLQPDVLDRLFKVFMVHESFLDKLIAVMTYSIEDEDFCLPAEFIAIAIQGVLKVPRLLTQLLSVLSNMKQMPFINPDLIDCLCVLAEKSGEGKERITTLRELIKNAGRVTSQSPDSPVNETGFDDSADWSPDEAKFWMNSSIKFTKEFPLLGGLFHEKRTKQLPFTLEECTLYIRVIGDDRNCVDRAFRQFLETVKAKQQDSGALQYKKQFAFIAYKLFDSCFNNKILQACVGILTTMKLYDLSPAFNDSFVFNAVLVCLHAEQGKLAVGILKDVKLDGMHVKVQADLLVVFNRLVELLARHNLMTECVCVVQWAFQLVYNGRPNVLEREDMINLPFICYSLIMGLLNQTCFDLAVTVYGLLEQYSFPFNKEVELKMMVCLVESEHDGLAERIYEKLKKLNLYKPQMFVTPRKITIPCHTYPNIKAEILLIVKDYLLSLYRMLCEQVTSNSNTQLEYRDLHLKVVILRSLNQKTLLEETKEVLETCFMPPLYARMDVGCLVIKPDSLQNYLNYLDKKGLCQGLTFSRPGPRSSKMQQRR